MSCRRLPVYSTDAVLAVLVFVIAALWGAHYWRASRAAGRDGDFYQEYFEPAVMSACGRGFVVTAPSIPALADFLARRRDRFDCRDIPSNVEYRFAAFQGTWRYLMLAVAATWKIRGIAWSTLGALSAVLFGAAVAVTYGIFRLGMGRLFALGGAFAFAVSPIHLMELPHLRDYAKAPFALACILIIGVIVARSVRPRIALALSALYGVVAGIGYGFRSDLLIYLPPFFITVAAFTPGGLTKNLRGKALSVTACLAAFIAAAWPILSVGARNGTCLWHFMLLGLTSTFTENLRVVPGPYDWGDRFADRWVYGTLAAFAERRHPELGPVQYCSPEYDLIGREYYARIVSTFPADMMTRALASIDGILRQPLWRPPPLPDVAPTLYIWRDRFLRHLPGSALVWVVGALLVAAASDLRVGLFLATFLLFFGGYPAIQFHPRHSFHLEFMTWWAIGFVVWQAGRRARIAARTGLPSVIEWAGVRRACILAITVPAALVVSLLSLRLFQERMVRRMFDAYLAAPKQTLEYVATKPGTLHPVAMPPDQIYPATFLEIDMRTSACGPLPAITMRYEPRTDAELSRTVVLDGARDTAGMTRVFAPVYEFFQGLEFSDESEGCVAAVYRTADLRPFPLLMNAVLSPAWASEPLFQRVSYWH